MPDAVLPSLHSVGLGEVARRAQRRGHPRVDGWADAIRASRIGARPHRPALRHDERVGRALVLERGRRRDGAALCARHLVDLVVEHRDRSGLGAREERRVVLADGVGLLDPLGRARRCSRRRERRTPRLPLGATADLVLVDGNHLPRWSYEAQAVIGGDALEPAIAAASILAKVQRDSEMAAYDSQYPGYGFARHKGYPTREHMAALAALGATPLHRKSFAPVRRLLAPANLS